jgi:signal transduction histidine kinase
MRFFDRHIKSVKRIIPNHQSRSISSFAHLSRMRRLHALRLQFLPDPGLDSIARGLFEAASEVSSVQAITFRLRNETTGDFDPIACHNLDHDEWRKAAARGGLGLSKMVVENKKAVILVDLQNHASTFNAPFLKKHGLACYLGVPLLARDRVIGVTGFYSRNPRGFDDGDVAYLVLIADLAAIAAGNAWQPAGGFDKTTKLETAPPASESADRAKAEFLNVMSHEFRTPISLILGHAGMMREGMLGEINGEQQNSLDHIMENSDNLLAMVLSILQASRIEAGAVRLVAGKIVLHELFDELKAIYGPQENDQRKIVWYCSPDLELPRSDQERIKDILRHLIDNAVKFTSHGRIVISAEQLGEPAAMKFTVVDNGVGIPPEALVFIFEKFRQSDSSGTRAFEGAGLGLYIAKKYAELLGGDLNVTSNLGRGSTFTLTLPLDA